MIECEQLQMEIKNSSFFLPDFNKATVFFLNYRGGRHLKKKLLHNRKIRFFPK
jgi:hypothetical protein